MDNIDDNTDEMILNDEQEEELLRKKVEEFTRGLRKEYGARKLNQVIAQHQQGLPFISSSVCPPQPSYVSSSCSSSIDTSDGLRSEDERALKRRKIRGLQPCHEFGCKKLDKGGGYCIKHGGGPRCKRLGCDRGSVSSDFCVKHGGGSRCSFEGCGKGSAGGGFCRMHGGGRRCKFSPSCDRPALGITEFCRRHGGGRFCDTQGCPKLSQGGVMCMEHGGTYKCLVDGCRRTRSNNGLCKVHSGKAFCKVDGCKTLALGASKLCIAHGGGPRCTVEGCDKADVGGGNCTRHGGGRRCDFEGCTKAKPGGSKFCCGHGGGRRCSVRDCIKLDQGGGLCKAHGGGRRGDSSDSQHMKPVSGDVKLCQRQGSSKEFMDPTSTGRGCKWHAMSYQCTEPDFVQKQLSEGFCRDNGSGSRCVVDNCGKMTMSNSNNFCLFHSVSESCKYEGCRDIGQNPIGLCVKHGGGIICKMPGCKRHAKADGLCSEHSRDRDCEDEECRQSNFDKDSCRVHPNSLGGMGMSLPPPHCGILFGVDEDSGDHHGGGVSQVELHCLEKDAPMHHRYSGDESQIQENAHVDTGEDRHPRAVSIMGDEMDSMHSEGATI